MSFGSIQKGQYISHIIFDLIPFLISDENEIFNSEHKFCIEKSLVYKIILLLNGGHKGTQQQDIEKAHKLLIDMED